MTRCYLAILYDGLTGYLRDERFEIDNNLLENAIRPAGGVNAGSSWAIPRPAGAAPSSTP
jgi:hypothetical protein